MLTVVLELPTVLKIIKNAEHKIFVNTGVKIKLHGNIEHVEHDLKFKKLLLQKIICMNYYVSWVDVLSKKRDRKTVSARYAYIHILKNYFKETYTNIGNELNRDHTSILHAEQTVNGYYKVGDECIKNIEKIKELFHAHI